MWGHWALRAFSLWRRLGTPSSLYTSKLLVVSSSSSASSSPYLDICYVVRRPMTSENVTDFVSKGSTSA